MKQTEKDIQNAILQYLKLMPNCFAWQNDSVGIFDPVKKVFRKRQGGFFIKGVADILGVYQGRPLAIEVKGPKGRITVEQSEFLIQVRRCGGLATVARSVDDVRAMLTLALASGYFSGWQTTTPFAQNVVEAKSSGQKLSGSRIAKNAFKPDVA